MTPTYLERLDQLLAEKARADALIEQSREADRQFSRSMELLSALADQENQRMAALVFGGMLNPNFGRLGQPFWTRHIHTVGGQVPVFRWSRRRAAVLSMARLVKLPSVWYQVKATEEKRLFRSLIHIQVGGPDQNECMRILRCVMWAK